MAGTPASQRGTMPIIVAAQNPLRWETTHKIFNFAGPGVGVDAQRTGQW